MNQRGRTPKRARRDAARQARVEAQRRRMAAKRRRRMLTSGLVAAALLAAGLAGGWFYLRGGEDVAAAAQAAGCSEIETFPDQGRAHISSADQHEPYNSNPPTSGPHFAQPAPWGFYDEPLAPELYVHNLEHGGTVIHFNNLPDDQIGVLETIADDYSDAVLAQANDSIDKPLVLTAWRNMRKCDRVSEAVVRNFIESRCNRSPEPLARC